MNWDALENAAQDVQADVEKSGGGDNKYLLLDDWGFREPTDFRVLPPLPGQDLYFLRISRFKIGKRRFYSKTVLGDECIAEKLHSYYIGLAKTDADIKALKEDYKTYKKDVLYMVPVLIFPGAGSNDFTPMDESGKVICFKASNFDHLHKLVIDAKYRKSSPEWGIIDRIKGRNLSINNGGKSLIPDPDAMNLAAPEFDGYFDAFYPGGEKYPDMWRFIKSQMKSDEHIQSVFEEYFEGGTVIEDDGTTKVHYLGTESTAQSTLKVTETKPTKPTVGKKATVTVTKPTVGKKPGVTKPTKPTVGKKSAPPADEGENPLLAMMNNGEVD